MKQKEPENDDLRALRTRLTKAYTDYHREMTGALMRAQDPALAGPYGFNAPDLEKAMERAGLADACPLAFCVVAETLSIWGADTLGTKQYAAEIRRLTGLGKRRGYMADEFRALRASLQ